jgi:flagellar protein FliO/FliZ
MNKLSTPARAAPAALFVLGVAAAGLAALVHAPAALAFTPAVKGGGEGAPLNLSPSSSSAPASSGGASIVRTIVGLLIVIAVIWGLTWVLRQVKTSRETRSAGAGLTSLATLALGSGRTLHLVRAGRDYLLVGSAEHGVAPIHRYTEAQAQEAGLLDFVAGEEGEEEGGRASGTRVRDLQIPGQPRPPALGGAAELLDRVREWTVRR